MRFEKNKWIARTIAAICIAVQALTIVPHHHHADALTPCFNIAHCTGHSSGHQREQPAEHNGCCHDHCTPEQKQKPGAGHECSIKIDAAQVVNERPNRAVISEISVVNYFFAPGLVISPELVCALHSFTLTEWRQQPFPPDRYALFIAEALSVRAPSLLSD